MRVSVTARLPRQVRADAVVVLFALRQRGVPLRDHLHPAAARLVVREPGALTWLEARDMLAPRVLLACHQATTDARVGAAFDADTDAVRVAEERQALRRLGGRIERACNELALRTVVLVASAQFDPDLLVEGMMLRAHATTEFVPDEEASSVDRIVVCVDRASLAATKAKIAETAVLVEATNFARGLTDLPANVGTPKAIVTRAKQATWAHGVRAKVISVAQARKLGMGLFSAVAAGAGAPGAILVLEYGASEQPTLVLLGKGVTHDTGGYNLKRTARLHELTYDKAGAAAVIGAMLAIARLDVPARVIGVTPLVENCIGPQAYKPGDVLKALDGTTVFVENTDAEGRLLLADCLTWVTRYTPELVIDIATLTAASETALGPSHAALFTNDMAARDMLLQAGQDVGELLWPMPIAPDHCTALRHHLANMRNMGTQAGASSVAAAFLRHFTRYRWAHIDMAGKAVTAIERDDVGIGATGFGTRLLVSAARAFARAHEVEHASRGAS